MSAGKNPQASRQSKIDRTSYRITARYTVVLKHNGVVAR
jgi:hypothetical protein